LKDEFELQKGEDAPMSMAAHSEVRMVDSVDEISTVLISLAKNNYLWCEQRTGETGARR
jgi:hypothetical protein